MLSVLLEEIKFLIEIVLCLLNSSNFHMFHVYVPDVICVAFH